MRVGRTSGAVAPAVALAVAAGALTACGSSTLPVAAGAGKAAVAAGSDRVVRVVAAENFWGSVAAQIGGTRARVTSIVNRPGADPHAYEPTPSDARAVADAALVIENGVGYDPWMPRLLSADDGTTVVLDAGDVVHAGDGANPHLWYDPADVAAVTHRIARDLERIDPADGAYFAAREQRFTTVDLAPYHAAIAAIRARYAGTPVGASESIFAMMAPALGLRLVTPPSFLRAVSEGADVSSADKATIDAQIRDRRIRIYVYNRQNLTPDVQAQLAEVRAAHIPDVGITETPTPASASFQSWQTDQLRAIESALARALPSPPGTSATPATPAPAP
ncbi:MAG TPA: zinc ABC transporter substrate-binding protein [Acidimicrobiales bacterium]|nr:zinc ABC transporter substrate-binding protein [Acidimicrobiales bacterium]